MIRKLVLSLVLTSVLGCNSSTSQESVQTESSEPTLAEGEPTRVATTLGPVSATVTLTPKSPLIGDIMELTLVVEAKEGVEVTMPKSREAFSRFEITDEDAGREVLAEGQRFTQSYKLQAAQSGRLRIPPLRVVFVDRREGAEAAGEERELLTEEIALAVRAVLPGDEASSATIRPIRHPLEEYLGPSIWQRFWWAFVGGPLLLSALVFLFLWRRGRKPASVSPYERASVALAQLEAKGLPDEDARDFWYVQLSSIVRRYLEDRFGLRAPELTTEEFLRVAQASDRIRREHKKLLTGFLADCDQVKFAGYAPGEDESRSVLEAARRFLLETRELDTHGQAANDKGAEGKGAAPKAASEQGKAA